MTPAARAAIKELEENFMEHLRDELPEVQDPSRFNRVFRGVWNQYMQPELERLHDDLWEAHKAATFEALRPRDPREG